MKNNTLILGRFLKIFIYSAFISIGCTKNDSKSELIDLNMAEISQTKTTKTKAAENINYNIMSQKNAATYYSAIKKLNPHVIKINGQYTKSSSNR